MHNVIDDLVAQATEPRPLLDAADPMMIARELLRAKFTDASGLLKLHRHRGAFWIWNGSYYYLTNDETVSATVWNFLDHADRLDGDGLTVPFKPTITRVSNVCAALGALAQLDKKIDPPAWLTDKPNNPPASELLAVGNGLLHLPTGEVHSCSPEFFNISASEVKFDKDAPEPKQWLDFLEQLFGEDKEPVELLQDWTGYLLSPDMSQQKILLMLGPRRSGKGTIARLLRRLLGYLSVAGPTMSELSQTFGLEALITKPLAILSDARLGARTNKSTIVERLLSISGEDVLTVPRKFRLAWNGQLPTRFIILTNELPSLTDGSGALAGRFMVLMLTESFFGREDLALTNKLAKELPGILNWALEGYRRLRARGYFVQPEASLQAVEDLEMLAAPVKAFLQVCCEIGAGFEAKKSWLWDTWKDWCIVQGSPPGNQVWFGRNLHSAVPGLTTKKSRPGEDTDREPHYVGLKLKEEVIRPLREEADRAEERRAEARRAEERRAEARRADVTDPF